MRAKTMEPITAGKLAACKKCQECSARCLGRINIPAMLAIYCQYRIGDSGALTPVRDLSQRGLPIDCIECEACTSHCVQGFDVQGAIKELAMLSIS